MIINLSPQASNEPFSIEKHGDILTINGEDFDFSSLPDGGEVPASAIDSDFFHQPVKRIDGELVLTLRYPIPMNATQEQCFPEPIHVTEDGPVKLPDGPEEEQ